MADTGLNGTALGASALIVALTLLATFYAARRVRTASDFWTAGGRISGRNNGLAIAGDFLSSSSVLGYTGLLFLFGVDGMIFAVGTSASCLLVLFLLAEKMRNLGRFTVADVLTERLRARPTRSMAAVATLVIGLFYLLAQLVGAGVLFEALTGLPFATNVIVAGVLMLAYVLFGGMVATTWVQIMKATLLLATIVLLVVLLLGRTGLNPLEVVRGAINNSPHGAEHLRPGLTFDGPINILGVGLTVSLSAAGLPHVLMRFFTVPDARAARSSARWAIGFIGTFNLLVVLLGFGALAVLGAGAAQRIGTGGNLALPALAETLGGGAGTVGGNFLLAVVTAIAFVTILAMTAGLVLSAAGAVAHDLWSSLLRRPEAEEPRIGRIAATVLVFAGVAIAIAIGDGMNVSYLATFATGTAASAIFPALLLTLAWRGMTTSGAVTGMLAGLISSVVLIVLSPAVWPGGPENAPIGLSFPVVVSAPLGFLGCWVGSVLGRERPDLASFERLRFRALTGIAVPHHGAAAHGSGR
jgi:cation/acetate symporter